MKISNKSWHYRFNKYMQGWSFEREVERGRHTTCSYIRTTLFSLLKGLFNSLFIGVVGGWVLVVVACTLAAPIILMLGMTIPEIMTGPAVAGTAFLSLAAFFTSVHFGTRLFQKRSVKAVLDESVVVQYVKDKHNKVCTIVKLKED